MPVFLHRWGDGPPVILLHGWTMSGDIWQPVAARLEACSLAPDLPAHGQTSGYAPSVAGGVQMLGDLIRDEGLKGATLVGWSLGALIGWRYLATGGAGVARMVSVDMSPCPLPQPDWPYAMLGQDSDRPALAAERFKHHWPAASQAIAQGMFAAPDPALRPEIEARIRDNDAEAMACFWHDLTQADLRADIARLPVPLLALHGAKSRVYPPETGAWLAQTAPQGQSRIIAGTGHSPILEAPDAVAEAITAFMRG
ncbi:alpha/beta fold hydrolase [Pararhodobacter oceanensis]|uniref:alpha/beta fold hydrolase n=1 Tax=Pararhodobacter oceanensis TaxID=2172121 RepID=UPI003A900D08